MPDYPMRILRPHADITLVLIQNRPEDDWTGITPHLFFEYTVERIVATGVYLMNTVGDVGGHLDWEKLALNYRIKIVRRGRSKIHNWEMVERHYLYKINIEATQAEYSRAARAARKAGALSEGRTFQWRTHYGRVDSRT